MKKTFIIHPFLFAIYPILFLYAHNVGQVYFSDTLIPAVIMLSFTLLSFLFLKIILKDNIKASLIVTVFLVLFFSYGHVHGLHFTIGSFNICRHRYLLIIWGILFSFSSWFILKTRAILQNLTRILNFVTFSLIIIAIVEIGVYEIKAIGSLEHRRNIEAVVNNIKDNGNASMQRDIYYIILDGYASPNTLKEIYDYDNHEFIDYLEEKGFFVASQSLCNYPTTWHSLSSSLNMEYINYLTDMKGIKSEYLNTLNQMIDANKVMKFLKSKGYTFIHFGSGIGGTKDNKYADLYIPSQGWTGDEFIVVLARTTMLLKFVDYFFSPNVRKRVLVTFSKLTEIHKVKGPKFVFAHILSPHFPFVFGADGEEVPKYNTPPNTLQWIHKDLYMNQLIFINKKVKTFVDEIISKSKIPPVIILQADHGPCSILGKDYWDFNKNEIGNEIGLREVFGILNAFYLPQVSNNLLYDSITPVNTFRVIFNNYFNTNYELLTDKTYYAHYKQLYILMDVTGKF